MKKDRILIVDDESTQLKTLSGYLKKLGYVVETAGSGEVALAALEKTAMDLVLTDMRMGGIGGLELLGRIKALNPEISVIVMTAYSSVEDAVLAMKNGAEDYLQKPLDLDEVELILQKALEKRRIIEENVRLKNALKQTYQFSSLISGSREMESVLNIAARAASSRATVLIRGESGTGKEMVARAIHMAGGKTERPFIAVNVAAVPENLIESEFFGHEKGAFTGADRQRRGRFETADSGTLFIDEIGNIPVSAQVKLLRVLQERAFERVGGNETVRVDVRVIAATNQDLEAMMKGGTFREDLFFRLNVIAIHVPPLRDRKDEIPIFIDHFLRKVNIEEKKRIRALSREAMDILMRYAFPGNVRELENIIHRGVILARGETITVSDLPQNLREPGEAETDGEEMSGMLLSDRVEALEKHLITENLKITGGNQSEAARRLGITERKLRYKLEKYSMK